MPQNKQTTDRPVTFAETLYTNRDAVERSEDELVNHVLRIVGVEKNDFDNWPFADTSYDSYDYSFELKDVRPGFRLTPEQQNQLWELGFDQCWLNYTDKYEMHYSRTWPQGSLKDPNGKFVLAPQDATQ